MLEDSTEAGYKLSIAYYKKLRDLSTKKVIKGGYRLQNITSPSRSLLSVCDLIKFSIVSPRQWDASLETHEKLYSDSVNLFPSSRNTIKLGMTLTRVLKRAFRSIEAERLVSELFSTNSLVHGREHRITKLVNQLHTKKCENKNGNLNDRVRSCSV